MELMVLHELGRGPARKLPLSGLSQGEPASAEDEALVDAVEVYHPTYTTILRSSGETQLRVFEHSHKAMGSSLHPLAGSLELDLGALLYAIRRLRTRFPSTSRGHGSVRRGVRAARVRPFPEWTEVSAPGRRRRWYDDGDGTLAVLIASASDVDDLIPTMVALQIELKKLRVALHGAGIERVGLDAGRGRRRLRRPRRRLAPAVRILGVAFGARLAKIAEHGMSLRVRMLGGTQVGYARVTRRWWQQVTGLMRSEVHLDRPVYFVSSNSHAIPTCSPGWRHATPTSWRRPSIAMAMPSFATSSTGSGTGPRRATGTTFCTTRRGSACASSRLERAALRREEREAGSIGVTSRTALDIAAQVIPLDRVSPERCENRVLPIDPVALGANRAVIVNIDYPLGTSPPTTSFAKSPRPSTCAACTSSARQRRSTPTSAT